MQRQLMEIEAIYQTAPIGLTILDRDLRYVHLNQRLAEINGIDIDDHIGRTVREIVPDLIDGIESPFQKVMTTGEPLRDLELSGETKAQPGVCRTWIENCYPLRDETGQIAGVNVVIQEITDRKNAEAFIIPNMSIGLSHVFATPLKRVNIGKTHFRSEGEMAPTAGSCLAPCRSAMNRGELRAGLAPIPTLPSYNKPKPLSPNATKS